jgi:hypothetical protein
MISIRSLAAASMLVVVLALLTPDASKSQASRGTVDQSFRLRMSTVVESVVGLGEEAPAARIVFHLEENNLCLFLAIPPSPTQLQANLFKFQRRIEGGRDLETLKFKFGKPIKRDDRVRVWDTCLEESVAGDATLAKFGEWFIDIMYREPKGYRPPVESTMDHPLRHRATGLDVFKDSSGTIQFYNYNPPLAEES